MVRRQLPYLEFSAVAIDAGVGSNMILSIDWDNSYNIQGQFVCERELHCPPEQPIPLYL